MKSKNILLDLPEYGQSYWLDNLTRKKISGGEIENRVTNQGLRGITSNPSIFNKAIAESDSYDQQIKELTEQGMNPGRIYEMLTIRDVQDACDILMPVFGKSGGTDGFVSLEVSPYLARNTQGTIDEVHRLFSEVKRPNCYIKIPGTEEGIPAIEQMIYEGIPINITLLFSVERYSRIAKAYVRALERRDKEGQPIENIVSVASFFLSRIDVLIDQLLGYHIIPGSGLTGDGNAMISRLMGKAGIASARLAYEQFREIFSGPAWNRLAQKGAHVQRPLWASTGNKDPLNYDLRYVESLIGENTVNTLPDETIEALADHGRLRKNAVAVGAEEARILFKELKKLDIDINDVTWQLENEGIRKFIEAYNKLLADIASKRAGVLSDSLPGIRINPGSLKSELSAVYASLDDKQAGRRLFAKDPSLWTTDPSKASKIVKDLSWLDLSDGAPFAPLVHPGTDVSILMKKAKQMKDSCDPFVPASSNPGISPGALLGLAFLHHKDKVTLVLSPSIHSFGSMIEQLITRRIGIKSKNFFVIDEGQVNTPADYQEDRIFIWFYLDSEQSMETDSRISSLEKAGYPVIRIRVPETTALAAEYFRWEVASAIASFILESNRGDKAFTAG